MLHGIGSEVKWVNVDCEVDSLHVNRNKIVGMKYLHIIDLFVFWKRF